MASLAPPSLVISDRVRLAELVQCILKQNFPSSTLVICSTQEAFMQRLRSDHGRQAEETEEPDADSDGSRNQTAQWASPTLRLLACSSRIKLAFCPDVTHLRAYLATYGLRDSVQPSDTSLGHCPLLVIVNPISLHRPTSAFSAQGVNRSFSLAIEAAARAKRRLVFAECVPDGDQETSDEPQEDEDSPNRLTTSDANPWDEEVSILNVTTKTFGAGERGWVGRTIKLRTIAERWCRFGTFTAKDQ